MTPSVVCCVCITSGAAQANIDLVVNRTSATKEGPVKRTSSRIEGARVDQRESSLARCNHRQLRETDIVADGETNLAIFWEIDQGQLISRREYFAFLERNLPGDINIE